VKECQEEAISVYPPRRILTGDNNLTEWRQRIGQYWFWDKGRDLISKEQAQQSIIIGDTLEGDELVFLPNQTERVCAIIPPA
jgi:hypothetical protein